MLCLPEDADLLLEASNGRMLILPTGLLQPKATKDQQGVQVMNIQYTVDDSARNYSEITVTIGDKKTEQQLIDIVHATNVCSARSADRGGPGGQNGLVVQLSAFEGQSYQVQQTVYQVQSAMGGSW